MTTDPAASPEPDNRGAEDPEAQPHGVSDAADKVEPAGDGGSDSSRATKGVAGSGAIMAAGTLTSRMLGLVRAILLAGVIGTTGLAADAFTAANTLPNQIYILLAGGTINAVLVPQLIRARSRPDGGVDVINRIITTATGALALVTVLLTAAAPLLVRIFLNADDPATLRLAAVFAVICVPQVFFYGLFTLLGQVLTSNGRFAAFGWAPAIANLVAIVGLLAFRAAGLPSKADPGEWTPAMIGILAGSATLSIAIQSLALIIPLRRMGFTYRPTWGLRGQGLGAASSVAKFSFAAIAVSQLGYVVTSNVLSRATQLAERADATAAGLTTYSNAFLIFILPHSLVTVSLVTALYPRMSSAAARRDQAAVVADHAYGLRMPAVLLLPAVSFAIAFAPLLTSTFFLSNSLTETRAVALVLIPLLFGALPYGWIYLNERAFYAYEEGRIPFLVQVAVTVTSALITLFAATRAFDVTAIIVGAGQSFAYVVGAIIGFVVIRRRVGPLGLRRTARLYVTLALPSVATAVGLRYLVGVLVPGLGLPTGPGFAVNALVLVACGLATVAVVLIVGHLARIHEVRDLLSPVVSRFGR